MKRILIAVLMTIALFAEMALPCRASWQPELHEFQEGVLEVRLENEFRFVLAAYAETGQMLGAWTGRTTSLSDCSCKVIVEHDVLDRAKSWKVFYVTEDFEPIYRCRNLWIIKNNGGIANENEGY